jgi:tRNA A37 threonylcarbamoyladenosine dehydratase
VINVIGAGAVGNSLTYVLSNLDSASGYLIAIDDDKYDKTNLNRCLLAGWSDLGKPKVEAAARALRAAGIEAYPFEGTIKAYVKGRRSGLRSDVANELDNGVFDIVVSCVDKGVSR